MADLMQKLPLDYLTEKEGKQMHLKKILILTCTTCTVVKQKLQFTEVKV